MRFLIALPLFVAAGCSSPAASWKSGAAVGDAAATPLASVAAAKPDSIVVLEGTVSRVCQTRG